VSADLRSAAEAAAACWVGAYLLGSVPLGQLIERWRLRHDLRRLERGRDLRGRLTGSDDVREVVGGSALPGAAEITGAVLDTAKVLGLAAATLVIVRAAGPPLHRGMIPASSGFGVPSAQVLTFWQSASLWAGLAAGVGHLWPVWLGGRGGAQGQAPLLALAVRFAPVGFVIAVAAYLIGRPGPGGPRRAVVVSLVGFVGWSWAAWWWDLPHWWGFAPGPEPAVWAAVLAGVVAARNLGGPALSPRS